MTAQLIAIEGPLEGAILELTDPEKKQSWVLGRDVDSCDIGLNDPRASRQQLKISVEEGQYLVENLSPNNKVFVNKKTISAPTPLAEGDEIKLGSCIYRFRISSPAIVEGLTEDTEKRTPPQKQEAPKPLIQAPLPFSFVDDGNVEAFFDAELSSKSAPIDFDPLAATRWVVKVIRGPNAGAEFGLKAGMNYVIGSDPSACDIILHDIAVSKNHAKLFLSENGVVTIEDLSSKNGTYVGDERLLAKESLLLAFNTALTIGTSCLVVLDKESEAKTIDAPSPILGASESEKKGDAPKEDEEDFDEKEALAELSIGNRPLLSSTAVVMMAIVTGLSFIIGIGAINLFRAEAVLVEHTDYNSSILDALKDFPEVTYIFNNATGKLFLQGHVLTSTQHLQLHHQLKQLSFITSIENKVVIDELVWLEMNQTLQWNPIFRAITLSSPRAGSFVLNGYLDTNKEAADLFEFIRMNFPDIDGLENHIVIEEDILKEIEAQLQKNLFLNVSAKFIDGMLTLEGQISADRTKDFEILIRSFKYVRGIREIENRVSQGQIADSSVIDVSERYRVTGSSKKENTNVSIVINGRILARGDDVDGMIITNIRPKIVLLEKEGFKYKIEY